jgi:hypothetical protein
MAMEKKEMRIRSAALFSALAVTVLTIGIASAQKAAEAPAVPKGHEAFFRGLSALAKKYPESAARSWTGRAKPPARPNRSRSTVAAANLSFGRLSA